MVQTSKSCNMDIAIGSLYWLNYRYCCVHLIDYCVLSIVIESFAFLDATSCLCPTMFLFLATPLLMRSRKINIEVVIVSSGKIGYSLPMFVASVKDTISNG